MRTFTKTAALLGLGLLCATATVRAQVTWEDFLALAKQQVAQLRAETAVLPISGKDAQKTRQNLLKLLDAAQSSLSPQSGPDTIYKGGLKVYDYLKQIYKLADKRTIPAADADELKMQSVETFNTIMYVYWNDPAWGP